MRIARRLRSVMSALLLLVMIYLTMTEMGLSTAMTQTALYLTSVLNKMKSVMMVLTMIETA